MDQVHFVYLRWFILVNISSILCKHPRHVIMDHGCETPTESADRSITACIQLIGRKAYILTGSRFIVFGMPP